MEDKEFHDTVRLDWYNSTTQVVREVGFIAIRTLITLNSGAFVVLLTFMGNTAAQSQFIVPLNSIKCAMYLFLTGLASIFISIVYTYVTAQLATPYDTKKRWTDIFFVPLMVVFPATSFLCFIAGVVKVISTVQAA